MPLTVRLTGHTPDPELTIAAAARLCYSDVSGSTLLASMNTAQVDRMVRKLVGAGHLSLLEHASFTFAIDGLSRAASHQLVRHRLASYSQQSQRYVSLTNPEFVTPSSIAKNPETKAAFQEALAHAARTYRELVAAGIAPEDARYILPNATCTRLMMTMNARELVHVSSLRLCKRAQWEILMMFQMVKNEVERVAPLVASFMQPKCETLGYCNETESCGRKPRMTE